MTKKATQCMMMDVPMRRHKYRGGGLDVQHGELVRVFDCVYCGQTKTKRYQARTVRRVSY